MDSRYWIPDSWAELWIPKSKILDSKILQLIKVVAFFFRHWELPKQRYHPLSKSKFSFLQKKKILLLKFTCIPNPGQKKIVCMINKWPFSAGKLATSANYSRIVVFFVFVFVWFFFFAKIYENYALNWQIIPKITLAQSIWRACLNLTCSLNLVPRVLSCPPYGVREGG